MKMRIVNEYGYVRLAVAIIEKAVEDYKSMLRRYRKAVLSVEKRRLEYDINKYEQDIFYGNPIMGILPISGDEIITELRSQVDKEFVGKEG